MYLTSLIITYSILYPLSYYEMLKKNPKMSSRHKFLYIEFKKSDLKCILFYAFFLIRRVAFAGIVVCLKDFIRIQIVTIIILSVAITFYSLVYRPFISKLQNILNCFNEIVILIFGVMMFMLQDQSKPTQLNRASFI